MKIALAQINPVVGDLEGNARRIRAAHARAVSAGADLVAFPEMALVGYPPLDLVGRPAFIERVEQVLVELAADLRGPPALVGCALPNPESTGRPVLNAAALLADGEVRSRHPKMRLPSYDVFDEDRYFESGQATSVASVSGKRVGVTICEDIWPGPDEDRDRYPADPVDELAGMGVDVMVNLSASPFHAGKGKERERILGDIADRLGCPALLVNQVGGNDSLLFDGRSLAVTPGGRLIGRAEAFQEDLIVVDVDAGRGDMRPSGPEGEAELFRAIVMGLRDYMDKCGFRRLVLGLSGGIDSALTAVLAAEAAGPERVWTLAMPSTYSSPHSRSDAERLSGNLGTRFATLSVTQVLSAYRQTLGPELGDVTTTLTEENLQARIRGALIMAFANHEGLLALATGNKSELAVGYCTLYGDMVGGLAPIGDLYKTQVYALANYINRNEEVIPRRIIDRPPSAELRPDQADTDSLPPYDLLDPILELAIGEALSPDAIVQRGFDPELVARVVDMVERSEFKRRQAAPVLRVTRRAFGAGRQVPIARGLRSRHSGT